MNSALKINRDQRINSLIEEDDRFLTRARPDMFSSSPLEDRELAWAGSEDWVRMTF